MTVPLTLLGLLSRSEMHGYDLKRLYDRVVSPDRPILAGQIYSTLQRLERDRRIAVVAVEQDEGPERRRFALTAEGVQDLRSWFESPESPAPYLPSALFAKVVVALMDGYPVEQLLDSQRAAHLQRMRELTRERREGELPQALLADFTLFHLEADLRWLDLTAARLRQLEASIDEQVRATGLPALSTRRTLPKGGTK